MAVEIGLLKLKNRDELSAFCFRKLDDMKVENKDMSQALNSKDTSIRSIQQQLEEKSRECSILSRQLQQSLDDAQKQVWNNRLTSSVCPSVRTEQNIT